MDVVGVDDGAGRVALIVQLLRHLDISLLVLQTEAGPHLRDPLVRSKLRNLLVPELWTCLFLLRAEEDKGLHFSPTAGSVLAHFQDNESSGNRKNSYFLFKSFRHP